MKNSAARLAAAQNLWDLECSICAKRGLDFAGLCAKWAEKKRLSLEEYGPKKSFDNLRKEGCAALPLALLFATVRPLRSFGEKWQRITGTSRQREQKIRAMEKAADALEDLLGSLADVHIADLRESMDVDDLEALREELISPSDSALKTFASSYVADPSIVIHSLRVYESALNAFQPSSEDTSATSSDMLAKYLFSAYVHRATGRFHDSEVSSLIGAALDVIYDETAHRMWRNRNYERIDKGLGFVAEILTDFGKVSAT